MTTGQEGKTVVDLKITGEVQALHLEPGDDVLVTLEGRITQEQFDLIREATQREFPDNRVIMLANGIRLAKVVGA